MSDFLIYGANGYTGRLCAREAVARGLRPILAGRSAVAVDAVAREFGLPKRVFGLDDADALARGLEGVACVLHCAGPFLRTSRPMADACLRARVHYLDVTGEIDVFEALAARDDEAKSAGIMLLPGVGFDVVPSDCLAAHLKSRLPEATALVLAIRSLGGLSHGTATTMVEALGRPGRIREGGRIVDVPIGHRTIDADFGRGPSTCIAVPWGDVATAWHSTGIPRIETFFGVPRSSRIALRLARVAGPVLATGPVRRLLQRMVDRAPAGPTDAERARARSIVWGEARSASGASVRARLSAGGGYTVTMQAAIAIVAQVLAGRAPAGFQTPSRAFGADFVLTLPGVERIDLP